MATMPLGIAQLPGNMIPTSVAAQGTVATPGGANRPANSGLTVPGAAPVPDGSNMLPVGSTATGGATPGTGTFPLAQGTATTGTQPTPGYQTINSPQGISAPITEAPGSEGLNKALGDTYGGEIGTALGNTLTNLGTATDAAVTSTNAEIEQAAAKQQANIASGLAASGISADSSTNALAQGDFASTVNANLASTDAQMQLGEENTLISALENTGKEHGADGSTWDSILGWAGL